LADAGGAAAMDHSGNPTHSPSSFLLIALTLRAIFALTLRYMSALSLRYRFAI